MKLDKILNDISDDITSNVGVSTEDILSQQVQTVPEFVINTKSLDPSIINKINTLFSIGVMRKQLDNMSKADYAIAQEIFTMLPEVTVGIRAKLTTAPSLINKDILSNLLKTEKEKNIGLYTDLRLNLDGYINDLEANKVNIENTVKCLNEVVEEIKIHKERLTSNPPIIVGRNLHEDKYANYNILTEKVSVLAYEVSDSDSSYPKYIGVLNNKFIKLEGSFSNYLPIIHSHPYTSLSSIFEDIVINLNVAKDKESRLTDIVEFHNFVKTNQEVDTNEINNIIQELNEHLMFFKKMFDVINTPDNVIELTKDLYTFLD